MRRKGWHGCTLRIRNSGSDGRLLEDESAYLFGAVEILQELKKGEMMKISSYKNYKILELIHDLGEIKVGDAEELHEALIAACKIIAEQKCEIANLQKRINDLGANQQPINLIGKPF